MIVGMREIPTSSPRLPAHDLIARSELDGSCTIDIQTVIENILSQDTPFRKRFFGKSAWNKEGTGSPVDALLGVLSALERPRLPDTPETVSESTRELLRFADAPQIALILIAGMQSDLQIYARLRTEIEASGDELLAFQLALADFCQIIFTEAWSDHSKPLADEEAERIYAVYARFGLPRTHLVELWRACIPIIQFLNRWIRDARESYFGVESGDLFGLGRFHDSHAFSTSLVALNRIADRFPPIIKDDFMREGLGNQSSPMIALLHEKAKIGFEKSFARTSGFPSIVAYREAVTRAPLALQMIADRLRSGDFYLTFNLSSQALPSALSGGVKNVHTIGEGTYGAGSSARSYIDGRLHAEASMCGLAVDDYRSVAPDERPKYFGISGMRAVSQAQGKRVARMYGESCVMIRASDVAGRFTLTVGDSLNLGVHSGGEWDRHLIPGEYADVLAPLILDSLSRRYKFPLLHLHEMGEIISYDDGAKIGDPLLPKFAHPFENMRVAIEPYHDHVFARGVGVVAHDYIEAQVLGPVGPDLIAHSRA